VERFRANPRIEASVLIVIFAVFVAAFIGSYTFISPTDSYPRVISAIGAFLTLIELAAFVFQAYHHRAKIPSARQEVGGMLSDMRGVLPYLVWLLFYFLLIYLIGLIIASGVFTLLFLFIVARLKHYQALVGGLAAGFAAFVITDVLVLALPQALYDPFQEFRNILRLPF